MEVSKEVKPKGEIHFHFLYLFQFHVRPFQDLLNFLSNHNFFNECIFQKVIIILQDAYFHRTLRNHKYQNNLN